MQRLYPEHNVGARVSRLHCRPARDGKMLRTAKVVDRFNGNVLPRVDTQHIVAQNTRSKKDPDGQEETNPFWKAPWHFKTD